MELLYFILGFVFAVYLIPLLDGLSAWFLTWVEAKKTKQAEIINQTTINMRQAATSAEDDSPKRLIGFCRDDDYEEEEVFSDIKECDGKDAILSLVERGIMQGDGKSFNPADKMTRAMLATVLYRLCGDTTSYTNTFTDVPEASWYAPAVSWAQSVSVVNGVSADRFSPDEAITREQMATILSRYANYKKLDTEEKKSKAPLPSLTAWHHSKEMVYSS